MDHERISVVGALDPISAGLRFQFHGAKGHLLKLSRYLGETMAQRPIEGAYLRDCGSFSRCSYSAASSSSLLAAAWSKTALVSRRHRAIWNEWIGARTANLIR